MSSFATTSPAPKRVSQMRGNNSKFTIISPRKFLKKMGGRESLMLSVSVSTSQRHTKHHTLTEGMEDSVRTGRSRDNILGFESEEEEDSSLSTTPSDDSDSGAPPPPENKNK